MPEARQEESLTFGAPGTYRIRIQGLLDGSWSDRLGGMKITQDRQEGRPSVTTLSGRLPDQAALLGVQIALYELHLPLLSVERIADEDQSRPE